MNSVFKKPALVAPVFFIVLLLSGCWNGDVSNVSLGDVSVGQQLLDLQSAHESGALNDTEYEQARQKLLSLLDGCDCSDEEDSDSGDGRDDQQADQDAE